MGRACCLSLVEQGKIDVLSAEGLSNRKIAIRLNRSLNVINNYLKNPNAYGTKKSSGAPSKLTATAKRRILRAASNTRQSSRQITEDLNLNVTPRTTRNIISKCPHIVRAKQMKVPFLTQRHKTLRLEFAQNNMTTNWTNVKFKSF